MRDTSMTNQDAEFEKLREQVFKVIPRGSPHGKKWKAFRAYMDFYYKDMPSYLAPGETRHHEK